MTDEEVIAKMKVGHEIHARYIGEKVITAHVDGVMIDARFVELLIDEYNNIICSYYFKPDLWDEKSMGTATYKWVETR